MNDLIEYNLVRSRRKTLAIHITDGRVIIRAPIKMGQENINRFIDLKKEWISLRLASSVIKKKEREKFSLRFGDSILFLGKPYAIAPKEGGKANFDGECFFMPSDFGCEQIKQACIRIYRMLAKKHIEARVKEFSYMMAVDPKAIKITGAAARWGSCSIKGSINFSWRLIMAEEDVVDYVIVHELAHLKIMNHSKKFWEAVERVLPDYKQRQSKLKLLSKKLSSENWSLLNF